MMPPKVGGFTLGFTVLMQGDDARHPSGVFDDIGMVTQKPHTSLYHDRHVLSQNQAPPVRHHGLETPGRIMEKVQQLVISCLLLLPESTERCDCLNSHWAITIIGTESRS